MIREIVQMRTRSATLGLSEGEVASVQTGDTLETAVRCYNAGHVGLASAVGQVDIDDLTHAARDALRLEVPYAPDPNGPAILDVAYGGPLLELRELVTGVQALLDRVRRDFPTVLLSNKVEAQRVELEISNDLGLDLRWSLTGVGAGLPFKLRGSPNIIDGVWIMEGDTIDVDAWYDDLARLLRLQLEPAGTLEPGRHRVVFEGLSELAQPFSTGLLLRTLATGSSLFSGQLGQQRFHPAFTLVDSQHPRHRVPSFDMEGSTRADPDLPLIEGGVLRRGIASKREAHLFDGEATANGGGDVSSLPTTTPGFWRVRGTADALPALLDGDGAIRVVLAMGAGASPTGEYAFPVQTAWRLDAEGQPVERLEGFTLTGTIDTVFGEGFVGATRGAIHPWTRRNHVVTHLRSS